LKECDIGFSSHGRTEKYDYIAGTAQCSFQPD
jgi:hypothetical protein